MRDQHQAHGAEMTGYSNDNPCTGCSTNQHCCSKLSGLFLNEREFNLHFRNHEAQLEVKRSKNIAIVSTKQGGPCPHWGKEGCGIYLDRPTDCRVFPYVTTHVIAKRNKIRITFHNRSDCPKKDSLYLLIHEAEIRILLADFVRQTFGGKKPITVLNEDEVASRLRNRIRAAIGRQWDRIRQR